MSINRFAPFEQRFNTMATAKTNRDEPLIGITQGRLSPSVLGRIQTFPVRTWQQEFELARRARLACIEWVYQVETEPDNPLSTDGGVDQILQTMERHGVPVCSVSADIYMRRRLITESGEICFDHVKHLQHLIRRASMTSARHVMIPLVDAGRLNTPRERDTLVRLFNELVSTLDRFNIELHIEADWPARVWAYVMRRIDDPRIRVCYDIGDRAALGYESREDLTQIREWLGSVHIKDRLIGGSTVPLGTGHADFPKTLRHLQQLGYTSPLILQAAPEHETDPYDLAIRNRNFVETILQQETA